jgi:hypothetical protein
MLITFIVWYLGSATSLNSHGCHFIIATVDGMCAENLVLVIYTEMTAVLDPLVSIPFQNIITEESVFHNLP